MYLLTKIGMNDRRTSIMVSQFKDKLESLIKKEGFYYSKKLNRYIDDKNTQVGGSGTDYIIDNILELK